MCLIHTHFNFCSMMKIVMYVMLLTILNNSTFSAFFVQDTLIILNAVEINMYKTVKEGQI